MLSGRTLEFILILNKIIFPTLQKTLRLIYEDQQFETGMWKQHPTPHGACCYKWVQECVKRFTHIVTMRHFQATIVAVEK